MASRKRQSEMMRVDAEFSRMAQRAAEVSGTSRVDITRKLKKDLEKLLDWDGLAELRFFPPDRH